MSWRTSHLRIPDLFVVDVDSDLATLAKVCAVVKENPATGFVPLLAIAAQHALVALHSKRGSTISCSTMFVVQNSW